MQAQQQIINQIRCLFFLIAYAPQNLQKIYEQVDAAKKKLLILHLNDYCDLLKIPLRVDQTNVEEFADQLMKSCSDVFLADPNRLRIVAEGVVSSHVRKTRYFRVRNETQIVQVDFVTKVTPISSCDKMRINAESNTWVPEDAVSPQLIRDWDKIKHYYTIQQFEVSA